MMQFGDIATNWTSGFLMIVDPVFQTLLKLQYDLYVLPNLKRILSLPLTSPMLF